MPIQTGSRGATLFGRQYAPYTYIDWFSPDQEAVAIAGGDAVAVPARGFTAAETTALKALAASGVSGAGFLVSTSRTALASDNGGTLELAAGVTYTLSDAVPLAAGVAFIGPTSGSATIAVTGAATTNGATAGITVAAGKLATAVPRASSAAAYVVAVQA